jgi:hypothetical protein
MPKSATSTPILLPDITAGVHSHACEVDTGSSKHLLMFATSRLPNASRSNSSQDNLHRRPAIAAKLPRTQTLFASYYPLPASASAPQVTTGDNQCDNCLTTVRRASLAVVSSTIASIMRFAPTPATLNVPGNSLGSPCEPTHISNRSSASLAVDSNDHLIRLGIEHLVCDIRSFNEENFDLRPYLSYQSWFWKSNGEDDVPTC